MIDSVMIDDLDLASATKAQLYGLEYGHLLNLFKTDEEKLLPVKGSIVSDETVDYAALTFWFLTSGHCDTEDLDHCWSRLARVPQMCPRAFRLRLFLMPGFIFF